MTAEEFLDARGKPHEARRISETEAESVVERVPDDLIEFWMQHGVGYYANRNYWLCTPALFEDFLRQILANVPELKADDLADRQSLAQDRTAFHIFARRRTADGFDEPKPNRSSAP